jgi:1-acyl-sn-glycerol-3-phosphate acyltransferase
MLGSLPQRLTFFILTGALKNLTGLLCAVNAAELTKIPKTGPLILYSNHINFLDIPVIFSRLQPRPLTGFIKHETWDSPFLGPLFTLWGGIPIRRGEPDLAALRQGMAALEQGRIVAIAPEGTRSGNGRLLPAHPGLVTLALHSGAPLMPLALWGSEVFHGNLRRLRRTPFTVRVGEPVRLKFSQPPSRPARQAMTTELMYRLAELLPPAYRGTYAEIPPVYHYSFICPYENKPR